MSTYDKVRALPLEVEGYELEPLSREVARGFTLRRTVVVLRGGGHEGRGEDIDYDPAVQQQFQAREQELPLVGRHTLDSFSLLQAGQSEYRRWALESAALDLALRQAGLSLGEALGRKVRPLRFVVSTRVANVERWLELYPDLRFKLDPDRDWTDELVERLAATGRVDTLDFKGIYRGAFGMPPDATLYARLAETFPAAWLEDPALTPETTAALERARERITWDAAIHEWSDVEALPFAPRTLNCKPSRFGSVRRLFDFYDRCANAGIGLYGGGQFELGPGRGQIQLLASLFHADAPNDVAPSGFNAAEPIAGLPASPLVLEPAPGFSA
jgi:L-alanine-DL-glutamate epimerase-like enolase superfamily enzyme